MNGRKFVMAGLGVVLVMGASVGTMGTAPAANVVMPDFTLTDFNGNQHTLSQYKGSIVVLDFMSHECPYSCGVDAGMPALASAYGPKGVVFLAIDSHKSTTPEQNRQYAEKAKLPYPILKDAGNVYADAVGATRTPEFYVIDRNQKLVYRGAFDNRKVPEKAGEIGYVKNALDDVLAGRPVKTAQVEGWGCTIKRAQ